LDLSWSIACKFSNPQARKVNPVGAEETNNDLRISENAWFNSLLKYKRRQNMSPGKELCIVKEIWQKSRWISLGESKCVD